MELGQNIARLRQEKNWSQQDLANAMEESRQSVARWEAGTSVPEWDRLLHLSLLFEVSVEELTGKREEQLQKPDPREERQKKKKDRCLKLLKLLAAAIILLIGVIINLVWVRFLFRIIG